MSAFIFYLSWNTRHEFITTFIDFFWLVLIRANESLISFSPFQAFHHNTCWSVTSRTLTRDFINIIIFHCFNIGINITFYYWLSSLR